MDNSGFIGLAKLFKENENKEKLGPLLAEVVEPLPNLKLRLLNGKIELDYEIEGEYLYISRALTNRIEVDVTFKEFESQNNKTENSTSTSNTYKALDTTSAIIEHNVPLIVAGNCSTGAVSGTATWTPNVENISIQNGNINEIKSSNIKNEKEIKENGKFKAQFLITLKKGDKVLVLTDERYSLWFIVDVFDKIKDVKSEWEYYQKS